MTNSAITTVDSEYSVPFGLMANGMLVTVWGTVSYTPEMAALLEKATGVAPYFIGKPNPFMMRSALRYLGVHSEEAVIVGDRMDTDIVAGMESGMETILVLTGVTKAEEIDRFPYRPTRVVPSVAEIELI
ncbi:MAG: HAD hydrolase-like protein [Armatimonadetes bacterium]|nr:HAD hydrolase-like protein [Armatimonadota bacterium]